MEIEPYPEEQKCGNCAYSRLVKDAIDKVSCRYSAPGVSSPNWPIVSADAWCGKWKLDPEIWPFDHKVQYRLHNQVHEGTVRTFSTTKRVLEKRIKEQLPHDSVQHEEYKPDPWGWSR